MCLPSAFANKPLADATMGMVLAEKNMDIPQILCPEDMLGDADELSNMTYISYFRDYDCNAEKRAKRLRKQRVGGSNHQCKVCD